MASAKLHASYILGLNYTLISQTLNLILQGESKKVGFLAPGATLYLFFAILLYCAFQYFLKVLIFLYASMAPIKIREPIFLSKPRVQKNKNV